jgi:hypothetical protein
MAEQNVPEDGSLFRVVPLIAEVQVACDPRGIIHSSVWRQRDQEEE